MERVKIFILVAVSTIALLSCKKEPVNIKEFVERSLVGFWQVDYEITTVIKNGNDTITAPDTTFFNPIDTVEFTKTLQYVKKKDSINFNADELGEKITFSSTPDSTWQIDYLRKTTLKLIYTRQEQIGTDVISHITERDYKK